MKYHDENEKSNFCVACDIYKTTVFSLLGVCENSHFGKFALTLSFKMKYILIPDSKYVLTNSGQSIHNHL